MILKKGVALTRLAGFIVLLLLAAGLLPAEEVEWSGKVIRVIDGDTIAVLYGKKPVRIRLFGIDCPEHGQAYYKKARKFTSSLVFGKGVRVKPVNTDIYGRTVAWVFIDNLSLNKEILRAGYAWHYVHYSSDKDLASLEEEARQNKLGLWHDAHPVPPWEFRRKNKR